VGLASVGVPIHTWSALSAAYHNAASLRERVEIDGPNTPFPRNQLAVLREHTKAAEELSQTLIEAATSIGRSLVADTTRRLWTYRVPNLEAAHDKAWSDAAEKGYADERT
jgi:hypothetical protein